MHHVEMTAALEAICYSILEIAETIEAISPEIGPPFREPLLSLRSRLAADPTPEALEESRAALHEILARLCSRKLASRIKLWPAT